MWYLMIFKVFLEHGTMTIEEPYPSLKECYAAIQERLESGRYNYEEVEVDAKCEPYESNT